MLFQSNTFRFLLSNLYDYDPAADVAFEDMPELDRFALVQLADAVEKTTAHFDEWRFYQAMRTISDYLGDLSSVYLDVLKDRLYADAADSASRRSAQTVLARILGVLVRMLAPVLSFTCEEVWEFMPQPLRDAESVHLADWPTISVDPAASTALRGRYATVLEVRETVTKALEEARNEKVIGKSQEAAVTVAAPREIAARLAEGPEGLLAELFIVASVEVVEGVDLAVTVAPATGEKCPRCWNYRELMDAGVCPRCAGVIVDME